MQPIQTETNALERLTTFETADMKAFKNRKSSPAHNAVATNTIAPSSNQAR
eukprot:m.348944 g.348944  ORF g.348944 m.348944 type:complete len:51 (-) comp20683_c0_seq11:1053-1205(-)